MINNSPMISLNETLKATRGVLIAGEHGADFRGISTDSRLLQKGNLFIALKGDSYDGHDFAGSALERGAAGVVLSDETKIDLKMAGAMGAVIKVSDTLTALGDLAHYWRKKFNVTVIGLTGSSGKTTTKEMIAAIIGQKKKILKTEGNLNNLVGLPQTLFRLTAQHEVAVVEIGTNSPGEIKRLTQITEPDIGLITNIGPAHLAGLKTVEGVAREKGDLFAHMKKDGIAVINCDDENVKKISGKWKGGRISFGMSDQADISARGMEKAGAGSMRFYFIAGGKEQKIEIKIIGIHNIYNAIAAAAASVAADINYQTIIDGLAAFRPVPGRMEVIKLKNGSYLLDDSYNANPSSMREALMTLKELKSSHKSYVFLGDMLELGDAADEMHRKAGMLAATTGVNTLFLKGEFSGKTAEGASQGGLSPKKIRLLSDTQDAVDYLKSVLKKGDWILVKGSRCMKMEEISRKICNDFGCETVCSDTPPTQE
ncbi:MAG TPA: UDP-N-acetylmuramoyl-tripeptide--D-alanyl-D-alanine ligase [Deltaproteobacteria bacterium]|nr:UDP-N-acetylmuramoyl-tripeptide--D-alanyl-D-alanine ligase [Deltaproteobacteria bacterium]